MSTYEISADDEARASLHDWLARDPHLRGRVSISRAAVAEGEMGGAVVLAVVAASAPLVRALDQALTNWMAQRRSVTKIEIKGPDGTITSVTNDGPTRPEALLQKIASMPDVPAGSETSPGPVTSTEEQ